MTESSGAPDERRQYPRRADVRWAFCYQDGKRFDACTLDVSAGGALVATEAELAIGATIIAAVEHPSQPQQPVHLVARVVRHQSEPVNSYGVRFVGVGSTTADEEGLRRFVGEYLGIRSANDLRLTRRGNGLVGKLEPAPVPPAAAARPMGAGPQAGGEARAGAQALPARIAPLQDPGRRATISGPITDFFLSPDALALARITASMVIGRTSCRVTLLGIGRNRALALSDVVPARPDAMLVVRFPLQNDDGMAVPIAVAGRMADIVTLEGEQEPGLLVAVSEVVEGGQRGLFDSWLRKLACRGFIELPE